MNYSIRTMLLGISFMILGVYIQGEPGIEWYGNEIFLVILGFIMVIVGSFMSFGKVAEK